MGDAAFVASYMVGGGNAPPYIRSIYGNVETSISAVSTPFPGCVSKKSWKHALSFSCNALSEFPPRKSNPGNAGNGNDLETQECDLSLMDFLRSFLQHTVTARKRAFRYVEPFFLR